MDAREIARICRLLEGANRRCQSATGRNAAYADVSFEFSSPAEGARQLYEKPGPIPDGMSLDRIDPSGPYSLENLRYATPTLQSLNQRRILNGWRRRYVLD